MTGGHSSVYLKEQEETCLMMDYLAASKRRNMGWQVELMSLGGLTLSQKSKELWSVSDRELTNAWFRMEVTTCVKYLE